MTKLNRADLRRGMWVIVDSGLASMSELANDWTLDDYMEAGEYLAAKAKKEAEALEHSRRGAQ